MRDLHIDIETYCDLDLTEVGAHKYAAHPSFEILLLAYAFDSDNVTVIDLATGERVPHEVLAALTDNTITKHAHNAVFELLCVSRFFNTPLDPTQWRCSMLHAQYAGLPLSLATSAKAIGMSEDKQKLAYGKALIRTFCNPCKPTARNGGRKRNLPQHEPEKWILFKQYNARDVESERELVNTLRDVTVPAFVLQQWQDDIAINSTGVAIDTALVDGALYLAERAQSEQQNEAVTLSGVSNPNSVKQLTQWLIDSGEDVSALDKQSVQSLLDGTNNDTVRRVLELRQEMSKTSVKKYEKMQHTLCNDGRIRDLLQFYGANRTGRWAGRLVQIQNLPLNHLPALDTARHMVKSKQYQSIKTLYGNVTDTLSQLIRTAFVPAPGHVFLVADYNAIEARVIAWLAGEKWVLDVFTSHGKIYEAQAAQMFSVPLESIDKGSDLRQKGKVATLALGYQGGTAALVAMGALNGGLKQEELPDIVSRWRAANKSIVALWYSVGAAALDTVKYGKTTTVNGLVFRREHDSMTVQLPSGRKLYYTRPFIKSNRWGKDSLGFWGVGDNNKWVALDTYGGKLVENIVQAIARDCLADAVTRLKAKGRKIVFHVHDEVVIEAAAGAELKPVLETMGAPIDWAQGLPLNAEGFITTYYKKD